MHRIDSLKLKDFRLYPSLEVTFGDGVHVITGDNAQGKTSLIEAIYLLALTKSHRTPLDYALIREGAKFAKIEAHGLSGGKAAQFEIILSGDGKKAKYNQIEYKRLSDYIGLLKVVMFAPEDLVMVKGSPSERRRFVDLELGQADRHYLYHLGQYKKLLKERNEHLKSLQKQRSTDYTLLEVLTEQAIHYAKKLIVTRETFVETIRPLFKKTINALSGEDAFDITYEPSMREATFEAFKKKIKTDILMGTTTVGPHRDDFVFTLNGQPLKKVASQGQMRTVALAIKLAIIEWLKQSRKTTPIILLDDVFSELDSSRQQNILNHLDDKAQVFITATTLSALDDKTKQSTKLMHIENGTIKGVNIHE